MATKLPRLNVVMEPYVYYSIAKLAKKEKLSLSLVARDLLREALAIYEDMYWAREAETREATFVKKEVLTHKEVWG